MLPSLKLEKNNTSSRTSQPGLRSIAKIWDSVYLVSATNELRNLIAMYDNQEVKTKENCTGEKIVKCKYCIIDYLIAVQMIWSDDH